MSLSPARAAAFHILKKVGEGRGHSDDLLHTIAVNALPEADRNLTTTLVLGTLRWQIALDSILRGMMQRPFQETPEAALIALRLGALQLLLLDRIPPHAALNESVELAKANGAAHSAGMVNAILRRLQREQKSIAPKLSAEAAHPQWLLDRWRKNFGNDTARTVVEADQQQPAEGALFLSKENAPQMDDGSRLIAEIAAASQPSATRILDCCAAPGGKTIVLARRHPEAQIVAADINAKRLSSMQKRLAREGITNVETVEADLTMPQRSGPFGKPFDLILCDAPCSGTGTLGRNPEIRHTLRPEELARQAQRQHAILANALALLAPGGKLVYSTCSLEPEENEDVVVSTLKRDDAVRQMDIATELNRLAARGVFAESSRLRETAVRGATLRTLPGVHAMDGFFAALFTRNT
ncbi:MAG: methyltransferase domain-containing protein [Acidobacteria bacterium]|nr:methyltransferase domain-containing protein [Acidobacteriota bacterium]